MDMQGQLSLRLSSCPGRLIDRLGPAVGPLATPLFAARPLAVPDRPIRRPAGRQWVRSAVMSCAARQAARQSGGTGGSDGGRRHLTDQGSISLAPLARLRPTALFDPRAQSFTVFCDFHRLHVRSERRNERPPPKGRHDQPRKAADLQQQHHAHTAIIPPQDINPHL